MERQELLRTLLKYEQPRDALDVSKDANDQDTTRVLKNDIKRIDFDFSSLSREPAVARLLKNIVFVTLRRFPVKYLQGMAEIASVITNAVFEDIVLDVRIREKTIPPSESRDTMDDEHSFLYTTPEGQEDFNRFISDNQQLVDKLKVALANIFNEKVLVFAHDNFKYYMECNKVFVAMMRAKGVNIDSDVSMKYMNHTLNFFKRVSGNEAVAYSIYRVVLITDPSVLFSLLAIFYENVQSSCASGADFPHKIKTIPENFLEKVTAQHEVFLRTREAMRNPPIKKGFLYFGAAALALGAGVYAAYAYNRSSDRK